jgi:hypothetical protein
MVIGAVLRTQRLTSVIHKGRETYLIANYILLSPELFSIQLIYLPFDIFEFDFIVYVSVMIIQEELPTAV